METLVPGLFIYPEFINEEKEQQLLREIDSQIWVVDYLRRLQYYGYRNELDKPYNLIRFPISIPPQIHQLSEEIVEQKILLHQPDQVIINEYIPGEGIKPHKDRAYYENQICGVNLGSGCIMKFIRGLNLEIIDVEIPRRSLYVTSRKVKPAKVQQMIPDGKVAKMLQEVFNITPLNSTYY
jgi:alkylated DNA repair dioxygenase AlkB